MIMTKFSPPAGRRCPPGRARTAAGGGADLSFVHIIWNPVAGNGAARAVFVRVRELLARSGADFTDAMSEYAGHAVELAKAAARAGHGRVIALGGDGTVREVASGLIGSDTPLALLPCGTGNDLARALRLPAEPEAALETALHGQIRAMDAATANGELFFNVAGFGFDVDVLRETEYFKTRTKNGSLAYLRGLLAAVKGLRLRRTHIRYEGGELERDVLLIAAGNGTHFGGGMNVTPRADPFDGLLDFCVIHDVTRAVLLTALLRFMKGRHLGMRFVTYFRARELTAVCEPGSDIEVDGEVMPGTPVTFRVLPGSIRVVVPA